MTRHAVSRKDDVMSMMPRLAATMAVAVVAGSSLVAQTRSVFIEDLTSPELRDAIAAGKTSAIVYAGGIEQNGAHMALIKHNVIARHVAGQIAERLGTASSIRSSPFR
jgi:creatinine amidohydrolase